MKDKKIDEANKIKADIAKMAEEITALETTQEELTKEIAKNIGVEVLPSSVLHFKDGEILFEGK